MRCALSIAPISRRSFFLSAHARLPLCNLAILFIRHVCGALHITIASIDRTYIINREREDARVRDCVFISYGGTFNIFFVRGGLAHA